MWDSPAPPREFNEVLAIERKYNSSLQQVACVWPPLPSKKGATGRAPGSRRKEVAYTTLIMFYCNAADNLARNQLND